MKKIILLLILPLTVLMAIDFTMTQEGLFTETATQPSIPSTVPEETSSYLEPVNLPRCDVSNPDVQFIRTNADWNTINSSKRIFCVSPGDYSSLNNIKLTKSGTASKKRYIILNNGNNIHPAKLNDTQLAFYALELKNAGYWVIDRPSFRKNLPKRVYMFTYGADHNVINRAYVRNFTTALLVGDGSHNNTIQKSRIEDQAHNSRKGDAMAILLMDWPQYSENVEIKNTKIISNEMKNLNDCLHLARNPLGTDGDRQEGNLDGTIVDNNHMYITSDIYTDGQGNYTQDGKYAYAENAIDIKIGSNDPNNPIIISNNHFWGYRTSDRTNSNINDPGAAAMFHFGVKNIKILNNVIFDSAGGIVAGDKRDQPYAIEEVEIKRNLIYGVGQYLENRSSYAITIGQSKKIDIQDNTIINHRGAYSSTFQGNTLVTYKNNFIVNNTEDVKSLNNSDSVFLLTNLYGSTQELKYTEDYTFVTDNFTNNSRVITLKNALIKQSEIGISF